MQPTAPIQRLFLVMLVGALILCDSSIVLAQRMKVAIVVSDDSNLFQSGFASAFRQIGDVELVTTGEHPDWLFAAAVVCLPRGNCSSATSYAIAVTLMNPMRDPVASVRGMLLVSDSAKRYEAQIDAVLRASGRSLSALLSQYVLLRKQAVVVWPRDAYQQHVREFVADIDSICLEETRRVLQYMTATERGDTAAARARSNAMFDFTTNSECHT
jgi:hypothetical protein